MKEPFSIQTTEDNLANLLREGFGGGLVKTLSIQLQKELKQFAEQQLSEIEKHIETQVKLVVSNYTAHITSMRPDVLTGNIVVNIVINHQEKEVQYVRG